MSLIEYPFIDACALITLKKKYFLDDRLQEYGTHNNDNANQRLSLYAGAGALAWMSRQ